MPIPASDVSAVWLRVAELAADPAAPYWASACAWVPGTGYCGNHDCVVDCVFAPQREAEAAQIIRQRRRRRASQQPFPGRAARR